MNRIIAILFVLLPILSSAQNMLERYVQADSLLPSNLRGKIYNSWVSPQEIKSSPYFWYSSNAKAGTEYFVTNSKTGAKQAAFSNEKLAKALSEETGNKVHANKLGISSLKFKSKSNFTFKKDTTFYTCNTETYSLEVTSKKKKTYSSSQSISPDSSKLAYWKDFNVWVKDQKTGEEIQATQDGSFELNYGGYISWYFTKNENINEKINYELDVTWSPDGKYLWISRYNRTDAKKLYMYKSLPENGWRSEVHSYYRPLAGDSLIVTLDYFIYNTETNKLVKADMPPVPTFSSWKGGWLKNSSAMIRLFFERGYKKAQLVSVNPETGKTTTLHTEEEQTYVDPDLANYYTFDEGKQAFFISEKSGWSQIYSLKLDGSDILKPVTTGKFVVRSIEYIDEKAKKVYFLANGREAGVDPYFTMLYSIGFNGKGLKLLTPENAFHSISILENQHCFVDNYSTIENPNTAVLKRLKDGKVLSTLEKADITDLEAAGWTAPEQFKVLARDGKTAIYGVMFRPKDFDPAKKYPVIDGTYSGPQTIRAPKTFYRGAINMDQSLANLGFIVVNIDGLGSAFRSKAFHNYSYKNLGDIGGPDHIAAIKQLAQKYPYIDTTRVGIYGHSAGGYDATRALIAYNDFYSVGVSSAGNHDHRIAKAWWPELYMGYPAGKHYDEQSNILNAKKLKGKVLLVHGDMDQNVNPSGSTRMAAELVKANKDFELLLIPGKDHGEVYWDKYFIRKRWDFFVKHLMGVEPPAEYLIK